MSLFLFQPPGLRSAPNPKSPASNLTTIWGKRAVWYWGNYDHATDAEALGDAVLNAGYDAIYIKASDGGRFWTAAWNPDALAVLTGMGLRVAGWHYLYGWHPSSLGPFAEALTVQRAYAAFPCPQILDVEYEYLPTNQTRPNAIYTFLAAINSRLPRELLAYAPDFRIGAEDWVWTGRLSPDGGGFPWGALNSLCGVVMPQLYVNGLGWSVDTALRLLAAWRAQYVVAGSPMILPIFDLGPRLADAESAAADAGIPSTSVWRWWE